MSIGITLFMLAPVVAATIAASVLERLTPAIEKEKERSPKREAQGAAVDESLAVARAMERRQEATSNLGPVLAGLVGLPTVPRVATLLADEEDEANSLEHLVPPEFRSDYEQMADAQRAAIE